MPKTIRFTELVKKSGKPQTVALWTKPKDNPSFLKAVRENRVLTVIQKPTGTQKDFAVIGFAQERFALYMVFPKSLPKVSDSHVVGINYQLVVEVAASQSSAEATPAKKEIATRRLLPPPFPKAKPIRKEFRVTIVRSATEEVALTVRGQNIQEAEATALKTVRTKKFKPKDTLEEIKAIAEM